MPARVPGPVKEAEAPPRRFVHAFDDAPAGDAGLLGGKGAGLARMRQAGLRVPPGFVITTDAFRAYHASRRRLPARLMDEVWEAVAALERESGRRFGAGPGAPLLLSVRSGARVSMPGMMDTVLNLGLDAGGLERLARASGDVEFAVQTFLRFWGMYVEIVCGLHAEVIDEARRAVDLARAGDFAALEDAILRSVEAEGGTAPRQPREQLESAIAAVFDSWGSSRAVTYRRHHGIPHDLGTAVVVQAMVFGNLGRPSGSGVCFTRDPLTGERRLYGEYLEGGQGEEVVAGTRTPARIDDLRRDEPALVADLESLGGRLEGIYRDALDIEFTIERGTVYLLQVRAAKRTAAAAVRIASELLREGAIDDTEALGRVTPDQVRQLTRPEFSPAARAEVEAGGGRLGRGIGASPGHVSGTAVLDSDRAAEMAARGADVILVRPTTSPQDLRGMLAARGIVTALGGATSHAAVVARALDKPCVVGCADIEVDTERRLVLAGGRAIPEGSPLSIDGGDGHVYEGVIATQARDEVSRELDDLLAVADRASGSAVWAAVAGAEQAASARRRGALGLTVSLGEVLAAAEGSSVVRELVEAVRSGGRLEPVLRRLEERVAEGLEAIVPPGASLPVAALLLDLRSVRSLVMFGLTRDDLPPLLQMPLGVPDLVRAQVRALTAAAGRAEVTALLPGLNRAQGFEAYRAIAAGVGGPRVGLLAQSPRSALEPPLPAGAEVPLWVDLSELVRTTLGCSEVLFESEEHARAERPLETLDPVVARMLAGLADRAGGRAALGIELGAASAPALVAALHAAGHRLFSTGLERVAPLRLQLAQAACRGEPVAV